MNKIRCNHYNDESDGMGFDMGDNYLLLCSVCESKLRNYILQQIEIEKELEDNS